MWMDMAKRLAQESHAVRTKVGAIFVSPEGIVSTGINGMPAGGTNVCETKVYDQGGTPATHHIDEKGPYRLVTKEEVSHAEENLFGCLMRQGVSTKGGSIFITLSPCLHCSKIIIQAGITDVYYLEEYRMTDGLEWLKKNGVNVHKVEY